MVFVIAAGVGGLAALMLGAVATGVEGDRGGVRIGIAAGVALILLVVALVAMVGVGPGDSPRQVGAPAVTEKRSLPGGIPVRAVDLRLVGHGDDELPPVPPVIGDLTDGGVLVLAVANLDPRSRATVHQCPARAEAPIECREGLPVVVDGTGRAVVLVELQDRFDTSGNRVVDCATRSGCTLVVFGSSRLEARTVFHQPAPDPVELVVEPKQVALGATASATADGLPEGGVVTFAVCRPDGEGGAECGGRVGAGRVDPRGHAGAKVTIPAERCQRGDACAVIVEVDGVGPLGRESLSLVGRSGAAYAPGRLRAGLAVALGLVVAAMWVLRRTDWTSVDDDPFRGVAVPSDPFSASD